MPTEYCTRCQIDFESEVLRELAYRRDHSLQDIVKEAKGGQNNCICQKSAEYTEQRRQEDSEQMQEYEKELKRLEEEASSTKVGEITQRQSMTKARRELEEKISFLRWKSHDVCEQDVRQALEEHEKQGYIEFQEGGLRITSRGARKLASHTLNRILKSLDKKDVGSHSMEEVGFGAELSLYTRAYEPGDDYSLVNVEKTALNALERSGSLDLKPEDFAIHEEIQESKLCAGLLIDESESMTGHRKLEAAMEVALALAELIGREPKDSLRVFVFSQIVREVEPWAIANEVLSGGCTDILGAMRAFREAVKYEKGHKQAYLITDADPNFQEGKFIGFDKAISGIMEEAQQYRNHNIGLNIIMLDASARLKGLATTLAQKSLGRVFFTTPHKLGQLVVKDYFRTRGRKPRVAVRSYSGLVPLNPLRLQPLEPDHPQFLQV